MIKFTKKIKTFLKYIYFGDKIRIDASTVCQLKCPVCQRWPFREHVGRGYLKFENYKKFMDRYKNFRFVELSNWGEIFLNPDLLKIIKYSFENNILLSAHNGVNLNDASDNILECLVKYQFKHISVSIDGASNEVYAIYRKGGNFTQVIENIKKINYYKKKYNSKFPILTWQFIIFGHNEKEIGTAKEMATKLNMSFKLEFSTDPDYSPTKNKGLVRSYMGYSSQAEREEKNKTRRNLEVCSQLWSGMQINWNGGLLGCCCNTDPFNVNVFKHGLFKSIKYKKYSYAKKMLLGKKARCDIPCTNCPIYQWRTKNKTFVKPFYRRQVLRRLISIRTFLNWARF